MSLTHLLILQMINLRSNDFLCLSQPLHALFLVFYERRLNLIRSILCLYTDYYSVTISLGSGSLGVDIGRYGDMNVAEKI